MAELKEYYELLVQGPYVNWVLYAIIAIAAVLVIINLGKKAGMGCLAFASIFAGLLLSAIGNAVKPALNMIDLDMKEVLVAALTPIFSKIAMVGYICLGVGVVCIVLGVLIKKGKEKKKASEAANAVQEELPEA